MVDFSRRSFLAGAATLVGGTARALPFEQRNEVSFLKGPYNLAFYYRLNKAYRIGAGMHFFHSKQHDLLQLTRFETTPRSTPASTRRRRAMAATNPRATEPEMGVLLKSYIRPGNAHAVQDDRLDAHASRADVRRHVVQAISPWFPRRRPGPIDR